MVFAGYSVGRVEGNLYRVTDMTRQAAFPTKCDGVVLVEAPSTIGNNIQQAVDVFTASKGRGAVFAPGCCRRSSTAG